MILKPFILLVIICTLCINCNKSVEPPKLIEMEFLTLKQDKFILKHMLVENFDIEKSYEESIKKYLCLQKEIDSLDYEGIGINIYKKTRSFNLKLLKKHPHVINKVRADELQIAAYNWMRRNPNLLTERYYYNNSREITEFWLNCNYYSSDRQKTEKYDPEFIE